MNKKQRDLRIDFFRGLSLFIIVANHIDLLNGTYYFKFSLKWLHPNFSDAAEIFVFLSGYVFGMVYYNYLQNNGFGKTYFRCFRRFSQLYIMNIVTLFICLAVYSFFRIFLNYSGNATGGMEHFFVDPFSTLFFGSIIIYAPSLINILPLYMFFLLTMPFTVWGIQKKPYLTLTISFLIYAIVQFVPNFTLPAYPLDFHSVYPWGKGWSFNPFVWQFLFTIGIFLAISFKFKNVKLPKTKLIFWIALSILILATIPRFTFILRKLNLLDFDLIGKIPLLDKRNLEILRLIHFFSLTYLICYLLPKEHKFFKSSAASTIVRCGQNSLDVFCLGIVLTYLSYYYLNMIGTSIIKFYFITICSWLLMIFLGYVLSWKKNNFK